MVKKRRYTYFTRLLASVLLVTAISTGVVGFVMIKKFTARPQYSQERLLQHAQDRAILINEYGAQPITIKTTDGLNLAGMLIIRPNAKRVWLMCHGYRMAKERLLPLVKMFAQDTILLFDYRAHGQSEGAHTSFGYHERIDVLAAINFLLSHEATKSLPLYGLGISMGAVSILGATCEKPIFKALILDSPFAQLNKQIERMVMHRYNFPRFIFPTIGRLLFERELQFSSNLVDACVWASQVQIPVLLIHSTDDAVSFFEDSCKLYHLISSKKELWQVPTCTHAQVFRHYPNEYQSRIEQFLACVN